LVVLLVAPATGTAGTVEDVATFAFTADDGSPLRGAVVAVYLEPFDAPSASPAQLVASGLTDGEGRFSFSPAASPLVVEQAELSARHVVNISIEVADFERGLLVSRDVLLPVENSYSEKVRATGSFPARDLVARTAARGLGAQALASSSAGTKKLAERARWVRITQHHIGRGLNGRFCYLSGRDMSHQVAVRFKVGGSWGDWEIGGWKTEQLAREAGSCAPSSAARPKGMKGPYHELRRAKYEEHKVQSDKWLCDPGGGGCIRSTKQVWRPHHWTGGLGIEKIRLHQARRKPGNWTIYERGRDFWKDTRRNTEFGRGVVLAGLELNSQTGYSDITKLWWLSTRRCRRNLLWGGGDDPGGARGAIYSGSRRC
jgi:hypothetical protein